MIIISGPCQLESKEHAIQIAYTMKKICDDNGFDYIFKSSFDKANRTSLKSKRGLGIDESKDIFLALKGEGFSTLTDVHEPHQCEEMAKYVDVLQIPAFLCRQTDLLLAAGKTGLMINVKKGQFLSPADMSNVAKKLESFGCERIILTERGTTFGYNNLVVDFRSIPIMKETGHKVCIDATHSTQMPGGNGETSGGDSQYASLMMKCGLVAGADIVFAEVHNNPFEAPSDAETQLDIIEFQSFVEDICLYSES